jgi:hypothetical protein
LCVSTEGVCDSLLGAERWVLPLSPAETAVLVVIVVFTFIAGNTLWQSVLNTLYIFLFPLI